MKILSIVIFWLLFFNSSYGQEKYFTPNGFINFFSHSLIEDIDADNTYVKSIVDLNTNEIAVHAKMKSFRFEKSLMEEHFNENYVESDKYPKAIFEGKISNFDPKNNSEQKVNLLGKLTLHGVTKPIETEALLVFKDEKLSIKGSFNVLVADYDIDIPRIVVNNIAKSIKVSFDLDHKPYKK